jgi:hypothetical protein
LKDLLRAQRNMKTTFEGNIRQHPPQLPTNVNLIRNAAAVIMKMAFGYTVTPDDPLIKDAEETSKISGWAMAPGRWLVDYYPISKPFIHQEVQR